MTSEPGSRDTLPPGPPAENEPKKKGRLKRLLLPLAMRYGLLRQGLGIHVTYRDTGGGLIVGGLSYAALFALIPTFVLVVAGIFLLVQDPVVRRDAIDVLQEAFPAFAGITDTAVDSAREMATVGGIVALIGFAWGASGLYLNLTRAMERFFPGKRMSGVLARVLGVLIVLLVIFGVLAAVFIAGVVTVIARALALDTEWILTAIGTMATLLGAAALVYGIYRIVPANPPAPSSARLPAILVGIAIGLMTLFYGLISPWLVTSYEAFGVLASVFVALIWLRIVFLAMIYGAAMARYRDYVAIATSAGADEPEQLATDHVMAREAERAAGDRVSGQVVEEKAGRPQTDDVDSDTPARR
jgi:membrane protein